MVIKPFKINPDEFLVPWTSIASSFFEAYSISKDKSSIVPGQELLNGVDLITKIAFEDYASGVSKEEKKAFLYNIDGMVDMLAYSQGLKFPNVGWGATALPDSFWLTTAGRAIVLALDEILGDRFCSLRSASKLMNFDTRRLYNLANAKQIPYYLHPGIRNPKQKRRIRLDHLEMILKAGDSG